MEVAEPEFHCNGSSISFNPYPLLGSPTNTSWPRGLPLGDILNENNWNAKLGNRTTAKLSTTFGVLQSLADIQPDVDAIFRLTQQTPFMFKQTQQGEIYLMLDFITSFPICEIVSKRRLPG